jgi:hypothetical protein
MLLCNYKKNDFFSWAIIAEKLIKSIYRSMVTAGFKKN